METVGCALCGCNESEAVCRLPDWYFDRMDVQVQMVRCRNCGLIYQNPRLTLAEMEEFYPTDYTAYQSLPGGPADRGLLGKAVSYGLDRRRRIATSGRPAGRLLDVGCGSGAFLAAVASHPGWKATGLEINPQAADSARQVYGLEIFTGLLEEAAFPDASFDVITLWDVLEHLHNLQGTLQEIRRILKPGGSLVVRLPNGDSWEKRIFGRYWSGYEPPRHLYVFGLKQLRRLLAQHGLQVSATESRASGYLNFTMSVQFYLTGKKVPPLTRKRVKRVLQHPFLRLAASPLFWLLNLAGRGPALTIRAEKGTSQ